MQHTPDYSTKNLKSMLVKSIQLNRSILYIPGIETDYQKKY